MQDTPETYAQLLASAQPRVIRDDAEHERALAVLDRLLNQYGAEPPQDVGDMIELLATLVKDYEVTRYPLPHPTPQALLSFLLDARALTPDQVARGTGIATEVIEQSLEGTHEITVSEAKALAKFLLTKPSLLLGLY